MTKIKKEIESKGAKKEEQKKNSQKNIEDKEAVAKAGKRSAKALAESKEKQAKESHKKAVSGGKTTPPKVSSKPPRSRLERAGKKYRNAAKMVDPTKSYSLTDAAGLITETSFTDFDSTVEMHINLNVDPKQADQNIRETVVLPAGSGKSINIAVIAEPADAQKAKRAGADIVGLEEIFQQLDKQNINFDVLITTPALMSRLAKYAKILGPRGLMPNPKSGTVVNDIAVAVAEIKSGKVEYRVDTTGIVHLSIGKVSFGAEKLALNTEAVLASLKAAKPASIKGPFITSYYLTSTMSPSVKVDLAN